MHALVVPHEKKIDWAIIEANAFTMMLRHAHIIWLTRELYLNDGGEIVEAGNLKFIRQ